MKTVKHYSELGDDPVIVMNKWYLIKRLSGQAGSLAVCKQSCCWEHGLNRHRCCEEDKWRCASWQRCGNRPSSSTKPEFRRNHIGGLQSVKIRRTFRQPNYFSADFRRQ